MDETSIGIVQAWLKEKNITTCPACKHNSLVPSAVVGVVIGEARQNSGDSPTPIYSLGTMGNKATPDFGGLVQVNCASCRLVLHFDAASVGLKVVE